MHLPKAFWQLYWCHCRMWPSHRDWRLISVPLSFLFFKFLSYDEWILKNLFDWFYVKLIYTLYSIFSYLCIFSTNESAWCSQLMVEMSLTVVTETNQFWNETLWDYMCCVIFRLIIFHSDIAPIISIVFDWSYIFQEQCHRESWETSIEVFSETCKPICSRICTIAWKFDSNKANHRHLKLWQINCFNYFCECVMRTMNKSNSQTDLNRSSSGNLLSTKKFSLLI